MSQDETTKSRTRVEDLPKVEVELNTEEQRKVLGGAKRSVDGSTTDVASDPFDPNAKRSVDGSTTD